jgi:hypothetical protein
MSAGSSNRPNIDSVSSVKEHVTFLHRTLTEAMPAQAANGKAVQ